MNLSTSRKKKKVTRRVDPNEPVWLEINPEFENYSMSKHWGFVWMAANTSIKDYKDEAIKYSKKLRKEQMRKFKYSSIQPYNFMTVGKYCHVMNRGGSFDQETIDWLESGLMALLALGYNETDGLIIPIALYPIS